MAAYTNREHWDGWCAWCKGKAEEKKGSLEYVGISNLDGQMYGNSDAAKFPMTDEMAKQLISRIDAKSFDSVKFEQYTFMTIKSDEEGWLGMDRDKLKNLCVCRGKSIAAFGMSSDSKEQRIGRQTLTALFDIMQSYGQ